MKFTKEEIIEIKESLDLENIFQLLLMWGGEPEYTNYGILSSTICHNLPGVGSRKLYYYKNSRLFICYTGGCEEPRFDIFELFLKVQKNQNNKNYSLSDAISWIGNYFGLIKVDFEEKESENQLEDFSYFLNHKKEEIKNKQNFHQDVFNYYDKNILTKFKYDIELPWIYENIGQEAINYNMIGYYPADNQITIPHFSFDNQLIGIRGRSLSAEDCNKWGKYRPLKIQDHFYSHQLTMNLYNLNFSIENIKNYKMAIIFESEKSCLQYKTFFGFNNDISVACCGSNISNAQIQLLLDCGVRDIIIALDRQFQEFDDKEHKQLVKKFYKLQNNYGNFVHLSYIFDRNKITDYKDSPTDKGKEIFLKLFQERVVL